MICVVCQGPREPLQHHYACETASLQLQGNRPLQDSVEVHMPHTPSSLGHAMAVVSLSLIRASCTICTVKQLAHEGSHVPLSCILLHNFRELLRMLTLNYLLLIMLQKIRSEICSLTIAMLAMLRGDVPIQQRPPINANHFFPMPVLPFLAGAPGLPLLFSGSFLFPVSDFFMVTAPKKLSRRPAK